MDFTPIRENLLARFERSPIQEQTSLKPQHELSEVQDMQQTKLQQTTPQQQPVININTHSSANVSYSTETVSTENPAHVETPSKKYIPEVVLKPKKNFTTATTPAVKTSTSHLVSFIFFGFYLFFFPFVKF